MSSTIMPAPLETWTNIETSQCSFPGEIKVLLSLLLVLSFSCFFYEYTNTQNFCPVIFKWVSNFYTMPLSTWMQNSLLISLLIFEMCCHNLCVAAWQNGACLNVLISVFLQVYTYWMCVSYSVLVKLTWNL